MKPFFSITLFIYFTSGYSADESEKLSELTQAEWRSHGVPEEAIAALRQMHEGVQKRSLSSICDTCQTYAGYLAPLAQSSYIDDALVTMAKSACKLLGLYSDRVCDMAINQWKDTVLWVMRNTVSNPKLICEIIIKDCKQSIETKASRWNITIPEKTESTTEGPVTPPEDAPKLKVLFITDTHMDPEYRAGTQLDCEDPVCCRSSTPMAKDGEQKAGDWGALGFKCDIPIKTVHNALSQITSEGKFDLVLFTGDVGPHDVYNQTVEGQLHVFNLTYDILKQYFPDTPVLSTLGNHESCPVDQFIPPHAGPGELEKPMDWLYSVAADRYKHWMPEETLETVRKGGFWAWEVKPGLKVISLNTNYGVTGNWYMRVLNEDVHGQMQWFIDELQDAEDKSLKVWVICHHPDPDLPEFDYWYRKTLKRYSGLITAIFYGHTHMDEFNVYVDSDTKQPLLVGRVGPGMSNSYADGDRAMNLGFQTITFDGVRNGSSFAILDMDTHILNLTESDLTGKAVWRKEYNMREAFGMKSLLPKDYLELVERMESNDTLVQQYFHYVYKSAQPFDKCDETCIDEFKAGLIIGV